MPFHDKEITSITFLRCHSMTDRARAFAAIGRSKLVLGKVKGLKMGMMMGSGAGSGFSIKPDLSTYALLCHWTSFEHASNFYQNHGFFQRLMAIADEYWTNHMFYVKGHGKWYGDMPFEPQADYMPEARIAVITRATIRPLKAALFWKNVPAVSKVVSDSPGLLFSKGIGEWPLFQQATYSIWENEAAIHAFAYSQHTRHREMIQKTKKHNWYREELFARFHIIASSGTWGGSNPLNPLTHGIES